MSQTITVRLYGDFSSWLEEISTRTGLSQGQIVRNQPEEATADKNDKPFMRWAGSIKGLPRHLSSRKGFSKS